MMDVDYDQPAASNVDDWLVRFTLVTGSKTSAFPFTQRKIQSIESRRARMSDLLILDVLLIRGGIRSPDSLFPPGDWAGLSKLLQAIDESIYDILKKDCLVYILLKWAWDMDPKETNTGWDVRYVQDRCIAPQFASLADAYWLLDTGNQLHKAVSILSDARLNRDYVSKILQALSLSALPSSFATGSSPDTAALIIKYVRTAKPLLTEPDDIDLYALSLAQLSFTDAWAYQKSFPEGSDTRERLLGKLVGWCLMPTPKSEPLAQLLAFPLSSYEQSSLHTLALPPQSLPLSNMNTHTVAATSGIVLSSPAISILQDLLCVRAVQYGDYVCAIKLDHRFSSVTSLGNGNATLSATSQATLLGRDTIDRKSIIQDLFATLPPAERTLLEDEMGKVATGVRANMSTPRQAISTARRPLVAEMSLSASWEDVGAPTGSPVPSALAPSSVTSSGKATPTPVSSASAANHPLFSMVVPPSPFGARTPRSQPGHQAPPTPKFTAFGSPIPSVTGSGAGRGIMTERGKTLFSTTAVGGFGAAAKPATRISLFDSAGSAKTTPNAFFKPPPAPAARIPLGVGGALAFSGTTERAGPKVDMAKENGKAQGVESDGEDVGMGSHFDTEIIEDHHDDSGEEPDEETATDEDEEDRENYITQDKSSAADLTLHMHRHDEEMDENQRAGVQLGFSVFNGSGASAQDGSPGGYGKKAMSGSGHALYVSPPPAPPPRSSVSPNREADRNLSATANPSTTTNRRQVPPGAFHHEEDDEEQPDQNENVDEDEIDGEEDDRASFTTPTNSPRRSTRTRLTPSHPSARSLPQRSPRNTATRNRPSVNQTIPGSLMDEDHDEHGQDHADQSDTHGDVDTETDEQDEEDDKIAPLPSRTSRRTRSSGNFGMPGVTSIKSKTSAKLEAPMRASTAATAVSPSKSKTKSRSSEVRTPARRSSRLSTASSVSPDHAELASPTKKGRKSTGPRTSTAASGMVATRSSTRRKR